VELWEKIPFDVTSIGENRRENYRSVAQHCAFIVVSRGWGSGTHPTGHVRDAPTGKPQDTPTTGQVLRSNWPALPA